MADPKKLTAWQKRHKALLEEALLNPDLYQELGYIRRDVNSPLQIDSSEAFLEFRLLRVMERYRVQIDCFELLKKFCREGGELDYHLITKRKSKTQKPTLKLHPAAKLYREAYRMSIQQLKPIKRITDELQDMGYEVDIQYVSKIISRMNAKDPNRGRGHLPVSRRRHKPDKS